MAALAAPTPLPTRRILILCLARVSEPISTTLLVPFLPALLRAILPSPGNTSQTELGRRVGLVLAGFAAAQFVSALAWGRLSDVLGRRPMVLSGLFLSAVFTLLLGFTTSFEWLIVMRVMAGLANGNVGVIKSMVAEITDASNEAGGFSWLPLTWGIGCVVGSFLGGALSDPAGRWGKDSLLGRMELLQQFPHLLPCAVASAITLVSLVLVFLFLEETLMLDNKHCRPFELWKRRTAWMQGKALVKVARGARLGHQRVEYARSQCSSSEPDASPNSAHISTPSDDRQLLLGPALPMATVLSKFSLTSWPPRVGSLPNGTISPILLLMVLAFQTVMSENLYLLWCALPPARNAWSAWSGGLGFGSSDIGTSLSVASAVSMLTQLVWFPWVQRRIGSWRCFACALTGYIVVYSALPFVARVAFAAASSSDPSYATWTTIAWGLLIAIVSLRATCGAFAYASVNLLIVSAARKHPHSLGLVNGMGQCAASASRTIAPLVAGSLWGVAINANVAGWAVWCVLSAYAVINLGFVQRARVHSYSIYDGMAGTAYGRHRKTSIQCVHRS